MASHKNPNVEVKEVLNDLISILAQYEGLDGKCEVENITAEERRRLENLFAELCWIEQIKFKFSKFLLCTHLNFASHTPT